jgi:DNA-directed RNA polymerase specialized sigma24 family protein
MLTEDQRQYAQTAIDSDLPSKCIDYFLKNYPCLREVLDPDEMQASAYYACTSAAKTYDPSRAGISAYFSKAILHELLKGCKRELKHGSRSLYRISLRAIERRQKVEKQPLADPLLAALRSLPPEEVTYVTQHYREGVSIRSMAVQCNITTRQIGNRIRAGLRKIGESIEDQPHWHDGVDSRSE